MDDFDRHTREKLLAMAPDWQVRAADMRAEVSVMYEEQQKKAAMWMWTGTGVAIVFIFGGVLALALGFLIGNVTISIVGAMIFLFGDGWITGSKLLYWTWNTRIRLERDIKEVHADVLGLALKLERIEAAVSGTSASDSQ